MSNLRISGRGIINIASSDTLPVDGAAVLVASDGGYFVANDVSGWDSFTHSEDDSPLSDYEKFLKQQKVDKNNDGVNSLAEYLTLEAVNTEVDEEKFQQEQFEYLTKVLEENKDNANFFDVNGDAKFDNSDKELIAALLKDSSL